MKTDSTPLVGRCRITVSIRVEGTDGWFEHAASAVNCKPSESSSVAGGLIAECVEGCEFEYPSDLAEAVIAGLVCEDQHAS